MAPSSRRYLVLLLATTLLFLIYQLRQSDLLSYAVPSLAPRPPSSNVDSSHFRWNNYTPRYPVQSPIPLPRGNVKNLPKVQYEFESKVSQANDITVQERQQQVKAVFTKCWKSYCEKAWMHDELSPISGGARDTFGGWAATLVDALDSLWIMGLKEDFREAAKAAASIEFSSSTDKTVNTFETTIRYLGGFLAAYDLSGDVTLLQKAVEVGEMLLVAFDTPNHMPISRWDWKEATQGDRQDTPSFMLVSELGSFSLEFTHLSQLTGDSRWFDAIQRITHIFDDQQERTKLPGMWPVIVNPQSELLTQDTGFTLGGMSDSLYEYLPKEYALLGGLSPVYQKLYEGSMSTVIKHLLFRPMTPDNKDILITGDARVEDSDSEPVVTLELKGQHLGCFAGGMFALGGKLFGNTEHVSIGRKLTDGCIWAYEAMPRGIMPEIAHFAGCSSQQECTWESTEWEKAVLTHSGKTDMTADELITDMKLPPGYARIDDPRYILRPEAIESVFVLYRITGDDTYREAAWRMFMSIQNITETTFGNAAIQDLTATAVDGALPKDDRMESFWLAETLKYFYLIFSEPDLISLDDYVLNTEAHPLRRPS